MTNKEAYDRSVATRNSVPPGEDAARLADLAALTKLGLGYTLESKTLDALAAIQADLRAKQQRLRERLEENLINPQEYLDGVNAALKTSMERSIMLLGNERFAAIFGEAGRCPEELIDSEAFLADNTSAH